MSPFESLFYLNSDTVMPKTNFEIFQDLFIGPLCLIISILQSTSLHEMIGLDFIAIIFSLVYTIIEIWILFLIGKKTYKLIKNKFIKKDE